jgi:hypothetical protein
MSCSTPDPREDSEMIDGLASSQLEARPVQRLTKSGKAFAAALDRRGGDIGESPASLAARPLCPLHPTIAGAPDTIDALIAGRLNGASVLGGLLLSNNAELLACPAPEPCANNCPHDKVAANEHKEDIDQPKVWDIKSKRNGCKQQESHKKKPHLAFLNHLPTTSWALQGCEFHKHSMRLTTNSPEAVAKNLILRAALGCGQCCRKPARDQHPWWTELEPQICQYQSLDYPWMVSPARSSCRL